MKALIFGAEGQVGHALAAAAPAGVQIVGLGRSACDVTRRAAVEQAVLTAAPDLVINAAAYTAVDKAETEPEAAALLNGAAPGWIAAAADAADARCIHISTDFVFDGAAATPYRPDAPTNPLSVYGRTKGDGEQAVLAAQPRALIVRTAWVYSATGGNFLNTMLRLMRERDRLTVVADQIGTPTHAASLARAIWLLAAAVAEGIHHFTDAGTASWYDFAVAIAEEARTAGLHATDPLIVPVTTADFPTAARRPPFALLDKSATWALLGGAPPHWRANLRRCIAEIAANG